MQATEGARAMKHSTTNVKKEGCPQELLAFMPLIANRTCPESEMEKIRAAIDSNPECVKELEEFISLAATIKEDAQQIPVPAETLLDDIMAQIELKEARTDSIPGTWFVSFRQRFSRWFSLPALQIATALAILVIIFQSAVIFHQSSKIATYRTLSGVSAVAPDRIALNVIFYPDASESALRNFLEKYKGQIIGGPGAAGVYTLSFPKPDNPETFIKSLKDQKNLILFAEIRN